MKKSFILLCMSEDLQRGGVLTLNECCAEYKMSEPTFRRYIADLRNYYWEKTHLEIIYDARKRGYRLLKKANVKEV